MRNQAPPDAYIEDQREEHDPDDYGPNDDDPALLPSDEHSLFDETLEAKSDNATNETRDDKCYDEACRICCRVPCECDDDPDNADDPSYMVPREPHPYDNL